MLPAISFYHHFVIYNIPCYCVLYLGNITSMLMLAKVGQVSERIVQEDSQWGAVYLRCSPVRWLHSVLLNREVERNGEICMREEDGKSEKRALAIEGRKTDR